MVILGESVSAQMLRLRFAVAGSRAWFRFPDGVDCVGRGRCSSLGVPRAGHLEGCFPIVCCGIRPGRDYSFGVLGSDVAVPSVRTASRRTLFKLGCVAPPCVLLSTRLFRVR